MVHATEAMIRLNMAMNLLQGYTVQLMTLSKKEQQAAENMDMRARVPFPEHRARMTEWNKRIKSAKHLQLQVTARLTKEVTCIEAARLLLRLRPDEVQSVQLTAAVTKAVSGGIKSSELGQFKSVEIRPAFKDGCRYLSYDGNRLALITGRSGPYTTVFDAIDVVGGHRKAA